jgi:zinc-ribbon domain
VHCTHCGIELSDDARFCSSCGNVVVPSSVAPKARDWDLHVRVLGWLVIAHAAMTGLIGLVVMFGGRMVARFILENPGLFDHANPNDVPPPEVLNLIAPITFLVGVIFLLISMPNIAAGVGLLRYRNWGRVLTLVLSFLRLLEFPFGTATAVYSFWVLLSQGGKDFYKERAARAEA